MKCLSFISETVTTLTPEWPYLDCVSKDAPNDKKKEGNTDTG